ncbi:hypothetical protein CHLRE_02g102950v5 [Chlamydomonas reinhardtii]|uniref:protein-serine/threonine phosphatase n=1 Tax=Chlamydomonas reinhardtii TaxID=3055 RepID=A0A2K3E2E9_CHLRE|nr:uncharacterized protein CHLRE_02g102950v5 [Chlamydomonas reinhardtii]PNW86958.1 hypothetical protein CHLRE_02g102950v5 [Chlamydomonas reinhardtii]
MADSPGGSLDDDLAAAFDGEFDEELVDDDGGGDAQKDNEQKGADDRSDGDDGGKSSSGSDVDLEDLEDIADKGFAEVETLKREAGIEDRPAKRMKMVQFGAEDESPGKRRSRVAGAGPSTAAADAGGASGSGGGCQHPVWVFGLCGVCGVSKESLESSTGDQYGQYLSESASAAHGGDGTTRAQAGMVRLKHLHASKEVEVSRQEADRIRRDTVSRLLSRRRLILILDLDHTLLNSVHMNEVGEDVAPRLAELQRREQEANLGPRRLLHCLADKKLWTKLRPGVFEFLEGLRDAYEMHIYTMGDKTYAAEVRRLLDPTGRLFSSVIAKDHSTTATAKHLDVLLSADELALVLDDTEVVWPGHRRNLLQIERYHFFPSDLRKWRADGTALLEQERDESATEGALATHSRVLRAVHARFFSQEDSRLPPLDERDVRDVLAEQKARILTGVHITFSRCWAQDKDPRKEPLWQLAEGLGATCLPAYDPAVTTHVVAAGGGTAKVHQARVDGKAVVTPTWLQGCAFRWERLQEKDFPVPEPSQTDGRGGSGSSGGKGAGGSKPSAADELQMAMAAAGGGGGGGRGGGGAQT